MGEDSRGNRRVILDSDEGGILANAHKLRFLLRRNPQTKKSTQSASNGQLHLRYP